MPSLFGTLIISRHGFPDHVEPLNKTTLSIGHALDNDIVLVGPGIGAHHALVHYDKQGVRVTNFSDRPSLYTNGVERTFPPGETVPLSQNAKVTIGPLELSVRLTPAALNLEPPQAKVEAPLEAQLISERFVVEPGTSLLVTAHVTNLTPVTAIVWANVVGLPDGWNVVPSEPLGLDSVTSQSGRNSGTITVRIEPPRVATTVAQEYTFNLKLSSDVSVGAPDLELPAKLTVLPYVDFVAKLRPERLQARRRGRFHLLVENRSNWDLPLILNLENDEEALRWDLVDRRARPTRRERKVNTAPLAAPRGERVEWEILTRPRRRPFFGRARTYGFSADLAPDLTVSAIQSSHTHEAGLSALLDLARSQSPAVAPRELTGELTYRPLPWWAPLAFLALITLLLLLRFPQIPQSIAHRLERRPTTTLQPGPITLALVGEVTPATSSSLSFARSGRVNSTLLGCNVGEEPCPVQEGTLVAALESTEVDEALAAARRDQEQAVAAGQQAETQQDRDEAEALQKLRAAETALGRLISGGQDDVFAAADAEQLAAEREAQEAIDKAAAAELESQSAAEAARRALDEAERQYAVARDQAAWVREKGTHPTETTPDPTNPLVPPLHRLLTPLEAQQFYEKEATAERARQDKEREYVLAVEAAKRAQTEARSVRGSAEEQLAKIKARRDRLYAECRTFRRIGERDVGLEGGELLERLTGCSDERLSEALSAVLTAGHEYETVAGRSQSSAAASSAAVADAEAEVRLAAAQIAGTELRAPGAGTVILHKPDDSQVNAGEAVATFVPADSLVELEAALAPEQTGLLRVGMPVAFGVDDGTPPDCASTAPDCFLGQIRLLGPKPRNSSSTPNQVVRISIINQRRISQLPLHGQVRILAPASMPPNAVWLPAGWVNERLSTPRVIIRRNGLDYTVPVVVVARNGDQVQIRPLASTEKGQPSAGEGPQRVAVGSWLNFNPVAIGRNLFRQIAPLIGANERIPLEAGAVIVAP